ncbi:transient-receptor-potential-like protein [Trichonephila clavipes]|nr:transient-receptor-potential-like protein [Trichonephila clavipes]
MKALYSSRSSMKSPSSSSGSVNQRSLKSTAVKIGNTFATLFWSLFGISSPKSTDLVEDDFFIETVGQGLFMSYHVTAIVVLINMLIAMMTKSFQVIEDHADREWKFARSKLWMGYFDEGSTLPPPFNLIISPKAICYFIVGSKSLLFKLCLHLANLCKRQQMDSVKVSSIFIH